MLGRLVVFAILVNFMLLTLAPVCISKSDSTWWNNDWSFRQEIHILIDTNSENAKYQPIDIRIKFDHSCWTKNEKEHSVRVIIQDVGTIKEIESQIYDLNYSNDDHIKSCSLVFLIPEETDGKEKYYVYYDDEKKPGPNYPDHVEIEESYYHYEPIPGYPFESHYFKITENGFIVYAVAQDGQFMGGGAAQQVTKLKTKSTDMMPKNGELFASFDFMYYYGQGLEDFHGSIERVVSKEISVDGNLMVKFKLVSESSIKDVKTTVTYKYYYCPTENKRICAHVKHEVLKEFTVAIGPEVEGTYASFQCGGLKSNSIEELNFGKIYPYLHVYTEKDTIAEYALDPDPEAKPGPGKWQNVMLIDAEDDLDLGKKAWISYDEGEKGVAHSLILSSNSVVKSGTNERDGVQIRLREQDSSDLPGLEGDIVFVDLSRNSYENGLPYDIDVPDDLVVEYDAEFFSTVNGGYRSVNQEADIFQSLVKIRPLHTGEVSEEKKEEKTCSLTAFVHLAPSVPMGSALSILTGKNFSYISAELYKDEEFISVGIGGRLSISSLPGFDNTKIIEKIKLIVGMFDWKNLSFFKKIRFQNLAPGRYLVKIYKEKPVLGKERRYIGFKIIDVTRDTSTHIFCGPQGTVSISVFDQKRKGVEDVQVRLLYNNTIISEDATIRNGMTTINAPCNFKDKYDLELLYKGFIIYKEPIKLRYIRSRMPIKKSINIELYNLNLRLKDTWGLAPEFEINSALTSKEMYESTSIPAEKTKDGSYIFTNLYPAEYQLELRYKSFLIEKNIKIPTGAEENIDLVFPAEFNVKTYAFNSRGIPLKDAYIFVYREDKKIEKNCDEDGFSQFSLPPGTYKIEVYCNNNLIGERKINVIGEKTFDLITIEEPVFPLIVICSSLIFLLVGTIFAFKKKDIKSFLKILAITLIIISVVSPWWVLHGSSSNSDINTSTKMFLIPVQLVTTTTASDVIAGELASLPEIFTNAMTLISILITMCCILIILNMVFKRFNKKKLSILSLLFGTIILVGIIVILSYGMSELAKIGVGGFSGDGNIDISIPGEGIRTGVYCNWGPNIGFYLCLLSTIIITSMLIFDIKSTK